MIFALSFLWIYYCLKSATLALVLGAVLAICSAYLIYRIQSKAGKVKSAKLQNKKAALDLHDFLKFNGDNSAVFSELYRYYGYQTEILDYDNFFAVKDDTSTYVSLCYTSDSLTSAETQKAIVEAKRRKADKLCIYCAKADAQLRKTAEAHFNVIFVDISNAYRLLEQSGKLPTLPKAARAKNSFAAKYAFNRKRFWWYLGSSIFMTLISVVAYFPYYTLSWATVMLILALYSLFNTRYNAKQTDVKLD